MVQFGCSHFWELPPPVHTSPKKAITQEGLQGRAESLMRVGSTVTLFLCEPGHHRHNGCSTMNGVRESLGVDSGYHRVFSPWRDGPTIDTETQEGHPGPANWLACWIKILFLFQIRFIHFVLCISVLPARVSMCVLGTPRGLLKTSQPPHMRSNSTYPPSNTFPGKHIFPLSPRYSPRTASQAQRCPSLALLLQLRPHGTPSRSYAALPSPSHCAN